MSDILEMVRPFIHGDLNAQVLKGYPRIPQLEKLKQNPTTHLQQRFGNASQVASPPSRLKNTNFAEVGATAPDRVS